MRRVCDDPFSATPLLQLPTTSEDPRNAFGEACGIYRSDGMVKTIPQPRPPSCPASRWSAPRLRGGPHQELMRCLSRFLSFTVLLQNARALGMRLFRHGGIYRSDVSSHLINLGRGAASRSGPSQAIGRAGRNTPCPSSAMSSGRLFLDRVARQHCPSPLHRHAQTTTHPLPARLKPDISTLQRIGHFYFALTLLEHYLHTLISPMCCREGQFGSSQEPQNHELEHLSPASREHSWLPAPPRRRLADRRPGQTERGPRLGRFCTSSFEGHRLWRLSQDERRGDSRSAPASVA